ncbi:MAG: HlyD family secretion protein [Lachnospiraceae bacterium]|nr:HlyD family secretion protein [Lachnospiraceae bacterium]
MPKKKVVKRGILALLVLAALIGGGIQIRKTMTGKTVSVYPVSSTAFLDNGNAVMMDGEVTDSAVQKIVMGSGLVDSVEVKTGTKVKKGDCILKYDKESVKLAVKADEASLALLKAEKESAKADIEKFQSLSPSEDLPEPYEQVIHHKVDPVTSYAVVDTGTAPSEGDHIYYCTPETKVTAAMLQQLDDSNAVAEFQMYKDNVLIGSWIVDGSKITSGGKTVYIEKTIIITPDDPDPDPDPVPEPDDPDHPSAGPEAGQTRPSGGDSSVSEVTQRKEEETRREEQDPYTDWILGEGVTFLGDGTVSVDYSSKHYGQLTSVIPAEAEWDEIVIIDPGVDISGENYAYSRKELADMIKEKTNVLEEKELEIKEAELKLKQDKLVSTDGKIYATMDGVVTEVKDPNEVKEGESLVTIKGNSGFTITVHVSEYDITSIEKGEILQVYSYETASNFTAEVTEISFEPETGRFNGSEITYYPVTAVVTDDSLELNRGEGCQITRSSEGTEVSEGEIVLPSMFIRKDSQGNYCMIADENDRLKRVNVVTGKTLYGSYVVVKQGISNEDKIAFPYGKNVHEGSPVVEKENMYEDF